MPKSKEGLLHGNGVTFFYRAAFALDKQSGKKPVSGDFEEINEVVGKGEEGIFSRAARLKQRKITRVYRTLWRPRLETSLSRLYGSCWGGEEAGGCRESEKRE